MKVVKIAKYQSARETIQTSSTNHSNLCVFELFSRPAHSNSLVMELLLICLYSKLADFFRNFTFDSYRDLKLSRTQENVKFKYFSKSMVSFQGLFKTNFVFKDFSRLPFIFKYFSSLCEPCVYSWKLFKRIFAYRQTVWTLIRLLLKEQSDLGPHCLQK